MTLLIVDMQRGFKTSRRLSTINACQREIKKSKKQEEHIIFLEYDVNFYGSTISELSKLVRNYKLLTRLEKFKDSGGHQVGLFLQNNGLESIRVCGVNARFCVKKTVADLKSYCHVTAIADGINDLCERDHLDNDDLLNVIKSYDTEVLYEQELLEAL